MGEMSDYHTELDLDDDQPADDEYAKQLQRVHQQLDSYNARLGRIEHLLSRIDEAVSAGEARLVACSCPGSPHLEELS